MQNQDSLREEFIFPVLAVFSLFFLLGNLHTGSLASWDEAIYAQVAKEAVRSGNWLDLTWQGAAWVDKPPVLIWATAILYSFFGVNEWTARLFSALCGVGLVLVIYLLGKRIFGRWEGFLAALSLLSTIHFIRMARFGMTDMPLVFFMTLSLYFFWRGKDEKRFLVYSGVIFGAAFLTKSFAAIFAQAVIWVYCIWAGQTRILRSRAYWLGIFLAALMILPWNIYVATHQTQMYMNESLAKHFWGRTTKALEGHSGTWYFYIRTVLNKYRPWVLVGIVAGPYFLFRAIRTRQKEFIFIATWIFTVLAVITVMKTKLHWYLLPVYPALSLAVGWVLARIIKECRWRQALAGFLVVMAVHIFYSDAMGLDYSRPVKGIASLVKKQTPADAVIFLYNFHEQPGAIYYWDRSVKYLEDPQTFQTTLKERGSGFYCFVSKKDLEAIGVFVPAERYLVLGQFEGRILVAGPAV